VYEYLEGEIAGRSAARVVLDVGGVGYSVAVPLSASFPARGRARVWTELVVREDSHQLFGFPDAATRDAFRALLTVSGVGPKVALALLSGLTRDELIAAIASGDAARLTRVRGIGRKTAEQILLDLKGRVGALAPPAASTAEDARRTRLDDAVTALVSIGYSDKEARKAVERAAKQVDAADLESLVRAALSA
jgi:Holliday junction DNA helicase RuvA